MHYHSHRVQLVFELENCRPLREPDVVLGKLVGFDPWLELLREFHLMDHFFGPKAVDLDPGDNLLSRFVKPVLVAQAVAIIDDVLSFADLSWGFVA